MSMIGTFDGFTSARLGIYAAQQGLRVTGNNISNINTAGYTRQRVDQSSFKVGNNDMYRSKYDNHVGSGALVTGINQVRDPFLDIRYRTTSTDTYYYDTKLAGLQDIASILDEVGKGENKGDGMLYAQLQDLLGKLRSFAANPTDDNNTLVRSSAAALTSLFRNYASRLDKLYSDTVKDFNTNINEVNDILYNIRDLNKSIRDAEIHGDNALEMRDERNRQIDELSKYISIKVEYSYEDVGAGIQVEKLTISMDNSNPDPNVDTDSSLLVDGLYATQLSVPEEKPVINPLYNPKAYDPAKPETEIYRYLYLDPNGNGTNSVGDAEKMPNDNFTVQLGKLLDAKGKVWTNVTKSRHHVQGEPISLARFGITVGTGNLEGGEKFRIDKGDGSYEEIEIVADGKTGGNTISLKDAQDPAKFAAFIVGKFQDLDRYSDYDITSDENGQIIFTAKTSGDIAPEDIPSLEVTDPGGTGWIETGSTVRLQDKVKYGEPADKKAYPQDFEDEYGNKTHIDYEKIDGKWYLVTTKTEYTREIALDDNDLHGILQAQRELLTEEGEFASSDDLAIDENAAIKRGIPYYIHSLDLLAKKFAESYNALNYGYRVDREGNYVDKDGNIVTLGGQPITKEIWDTGLTQEQKDALIADGYVDENNEADLDAYLRAVGAAMGGPLFSNRNDGDDTTDINAHNIDISYSWSHNVYGVIPKFEVYYADDDNPDGLAQSTQNVNANHMVSLLDKTLVYDPRELIPDADGPSLFEGSFNDMFSNMMAVQADDARMTNVRLTNSSVALTELDYSREGVSGVDLNDEAMNMMQFQKAMNAAMRVMTTIDEALDRLINNTGMAGR